MAAPASARAARDRSILASLIARDGSPEHQVAVERILAEFPTVADAIWGNESRLRRAGVDEDVIDHLVAVRTTIRHVLAQPLSAAPVLGNRKALLAYLTADMGFHQVERVRVLHLNTRNMLIRDELLCEGTIDEAPVHVREVMRRALELGAASLILAHNHPSGDPKPSRADVALSQAIERAGRPLGVALHDHLIIAGTQHISLRAQGLLA